MTPKTIAIRNPAIRDLVAQQRDAGAGRTCTEAAETLIREAIEQRRIAAVARPALRQRRKREAVTA